MLMVRDGKDVQLDNVARTVICNNVADCHIALHWDSDGLSYDKGCFYASVPKQLKNRKTGLLLIGKNMMLWEKL